MLGVSPSPGFRILHEPIFETNAKHENLASEIWSKDCESLKYRKGPATHQKADQTPEKMRGVSLPRSSRVLHDSDREPSPQTVPWKAQSQKPEKVLDVSPPSGVRVLHEPVSEVTVNHLHQHTICDTWNQK